ncbi:MAG TPA: BTAD domain-containing putative transcriptional regulator [Gaiellaceae bacterium]
MEFRVLGPFELAVEGRAVPLNAAKPRALLAMLLLSANKPLSSARLIEDLWAGRPPATAVKVLQAYVSQLRRLLGSEAIATGPSGYALSVGPGELDLHRFERLVSAAAGADPAAAASRLRQALALWRGPPLVDFAYEPWAQLEIGRLNELHVVALEERIEAELVLGLAAELVGELELLVAEHPLRERLHGQLMLALYRSNRQAEALEVYRQARQTLVAQLGIEPGPALRRLESEVLRQDAHLDLPLPQSAGARRAQPAPSLPPRLNSFVGRHRELLEIRELLGSPEVRLLTLTGAAGTGKTRLAVEAAAGLEAEFPDGVGFVELAPISDPDLLATTIAETLALGETHGRRPTEILVAYLQRRRLLLILDNFEQLLPAAPVVTELLAGAPHLKVLVTSRAPLALGQERIQAVPALRLPDPMSVGDVERLRRTEAVSLFTDRACTVRPEFEVSTANASAVAELCRRLDALPLALELAAARVRVLSVDAILDRVGRSLELLKAQPGAALTERHRTLRAAIAWSYALLAADERELFTGLGVFVGGFSLAGAKAVGGASSFEVGDVVESLLNNSLLRTERSAAGEPRFGMLETIREYARERLAESASVETIRRRHARFYLQLAEEAEPGLRGPEQVRWLERLDPERDNLRAALRWATETGETEVGLRSGAALWRYWQLRGFETEGRDTLERLLAQGSGSRVARAMAQSRVASLAYMQGDLPALRRFGEQCLPVLRELGIDREVATILGILGQSVLAQGEAERARTLTVEGLELARRSGDLWTEAMLLANAGVALAAVGELDQAERMLEESVQGARQVGNIRGIGNWLRCLGGIAVARRDYERARPLLEESVAILRTLGDSLSISQTLAHLALVAAETGDRGLARQLLEESISLERDAGPRPGLACNLEVAAKLAIDEGCPARAARMLGSASAHRESVGGTIMEVGWPDWAPQIAQIRATLGEKAFAEAWGEGRAMTFAESTAYALENAAGPSVGRGAVNG